MTLLALFILLGFVLKTASTLPGSRLPEYPAWDLVDRGGCVVGAVVNLYLIERTDRIDYDEYDSDVVAAPDEAKAREISYVGKTQGSTCTLIGTSNSPKPINVLASFNAG